MGVIPTDYASIGVTQKRTVLNTITAYLILLVPELMRHFWGLDSGNISTILTLMLWDSTKRNSIYYKEIAFNLGITGMCMMIAYLLLLTHVYTEEGAQNVYLWFAVLTMPFRLTGLLRM